ILAFVGLRILLAGLCRVAVFTRALSGRRRRLPVTCDGYACDDEAECAHQNGEGDCRQLLLHSAFLPLVVPSPKWCMSVPRLESLVRVPRLEDPSFEARVTAAQEMGCGSGMTCWRRLHEWQQAGVWQRLHEVLLAKL